MSTTAPTTALRAASWMRTVVTPHATVLLDYRTGAIALLTGAASRVWLAVLDGPTVATATSDDAVSTVAAITSNFGRRGWLIHAPLAAPPAVRLVEAAPASWGTQETRAQLDPPGPAPWRWRIAAFPVVLLVVLVRQLGRRDQRFARLLRLTHWGAHFSPAGDLQARHAVRAARLAGRVLPARFACLEESVAAAVLLAGAGLRARWCHGVAIDPLRLHAWLDNSDGQPIDEPCDTDRYTRITQTPAGVRTETADEPAADHAPR